MELEEIKKAIDGRAPLVITETGEIQEGGGDGEEFRRLPRDRWY